MSKTSGFLVVVVTFLLGIIVGSTAEAHMREGEQN